MFGLKKLVVVATTLTALAIPSLAMADDYDHRGRDRGDDRAIAVLRAEIQRDRIELKRDEYNHRWEKARQERREIEQREARLRELMRHDSGRR